MYDVRTYMKIGKTSDQNYSIELSFGRCMAVYLRQSSGCIGASESRYLRSATWYKSCHKPRTVRAAFLRILVRHVLANRSYRSYAFHANTFAAKSFCAHKELISAHSRRAPRLSWNENIDTYWFCNEAKNTGEYEILVWISRIRTPRNLRSLYLYLA